MKFYILGTSKRDSVLKTRKALFSSKDFEEALVQFDKLSEQDKYKYLYLLVDFEIEKRNFFKTYHIVDTKSNTLPFFILAQNNFGIKTIKKSAKHNITVIETEGFSNEINNNVTAMRRFLQLLENGEKVVWKIGIHNISTFETCEKIIADSEMIKKSDNKFGIRKLITQQYPWYSNSCQ